MSEPTDPEGLERLRLAVRSFTEARDWRQFHTPKNLACALVTEAAELLEHFRWEDLRAADLGEARRQAVEDEIADVFIFLVRMADELDVDLEAAAYRKLERNEARYPADAARGNAKKYTDL